MTHQYNFPVFLKDFQKQLREATIEEVRRRLETLKVERPNSVDEELPYEVKDAWLKEVGSCISSTLDDMIKENK